LFRPLAGGGNYREDGLNFGYISINRRETPFIFEIVSYNVSIIKIDNDFFNIFEIREEKGGGNYLREGNYSSIYGI